MDRWNSKLDGISKVISIRLIKNYAVESCRYELAAFVRDREKSLIKDHQVDESHLKGRIDIKDITADQLKYINEFLNEINIAYEAKPILDIINKDLVPVIRNKKIDKLLE